MSYYMLPYFLQVFQVVRQEFLKERNEQMMFLAFLKTWFNYTLYVKFISDFVREDSLSTPGIQPSPRSHLGFYETR